MKLPEVQPIPGSEIPEQLTVDAVLSACAAPMHVRWMGASYEMDVLNEGVDCDTGAEAVM